MLVNKPKMLAKYTKKFLRSTEYKIHPKQFPNMNAQGNGFRSPRVPVVCTALYVSRMAAVHMKLAVIPPAIGHKYSSMSTEADTMMLAGIRGTHGFHSRFCDYDSSFLSDSSRFG